MSGIMVHCCVLSCWLASVEPEKLVHITMSKRCVEHTPLFLNCAGRHVCSWQTNLSAICTTERVTAPVRTCSESTSFSACPGVRNHLQLLAANDSGCQSVMCQFKVGLGKVKETLLPLLVFTATSSTFVSSSLVLHLFYFFVCFLSFWFVK